MRLKDAILAAMQRDDLKTVVQDYELDEVDQRSRDAMTDALRSAKRVRVDGLLEYLSEQQVKTVCEQYGVSPTGRRRMLIERLIEARQGRQRARTDNRDAGRAGGEEEEAETAPSLPEPEPQPQWIEPPRAATVPVVNITKPELIWPGKYDSQGNRVIDRGVALPFQVVETIQEGRATREPGRSADLFSAKPSGEAAWRNKLIWGDNLLVMASLLEEFAGKVDLIYVDPPFHSGADFGITTQIGDADLSKSPSVLEEKAYRDTWGAGLTSYLPWLECRLALIRQLLSPRGSVFVHLDWHVGHHARILLDDIFGAKNFRNEIVWYYYNRFAADGQNFGRKHDNIFWYCRSHEVIYRPIDEEREIPQKRLLRKKQAGRAVNVRDDGGNLVYFEQATRRVDDVWRIPLVPPASSDYASFETQKPVELPSRIMEACTEADSVVADFFCGSGTTLLAAEKRGLRWIGCDLGRFAIHTTRKRLLDIPGCKPFEILNLGQYERKYWQGVTFGDERPKEPNQAAVAAYVRFILDLYRAHPLPGTHIHGRKGAALVHVGAVDAPVTISEINAALAECAELKQRELHVLGWEWEMGLHDPLVQQAKRAHDLRLRLLNIPREVMERQAVDRGDVRFFDLAHLQAEIVTAKRGICVRLTDFVIPDTELIPEEVRSKIRKWSDYIDYWAVDWDFQHDTFMNQWQAYRTRKNRKLELESAAHEYDKRGRYQILVKVVDIFGNDTSRLLSWDAR